MRWTILFFLFIVWHNTFLQYKRKKKTYKIHGHNYVNRITYIYNTHNTNINNTYVTIINLLTIHDALNSNGNGILVTRNKLNGDKR